MITLQDIQDAQEAIDNKIGTGPSPDACNLNGINSALSGLQETLASLKEAYASENAPFANTTFVLRLAANTNAPTLQSTNKPLADVIIASGLRPASLVIDGVTVTTVGSTTTLSVDGPLDMEAAAEVLAAFVETKGIIVDANTAKQSKDTNKSKAKELWQFAKTQQLLIDLIQGHEPTPLKMEPEVELQALGTLEATSEWIDGENLSIVVTGAIEHEDNVFPPDIAKDFADILDLNNRPNELWTVVSLNLRDILTEAGLSGDVFISQTNAAMLLGWPTAPNPKLKVYDIATLDDKFNIMVGNGTSATLEIWSGTTNIGPAALTLTIDATGLTVVGE